MSLPWFAERFTGWLVRIGAKKRPDPYTHCLPLSDAGEFVGVNTVNPLTVKIVRTAKEAGRQLLEGKEPYWRHRPKQEITMALPSDVQAAVDAAIAAAQASVSDAVDALTSGAAQMIAAAAALGGKADEHPALDEVVTDLSQATAQLSGQLGNAVATFRAASKQLSDALPATPAPTP